MINLAPHNGEPVVMESMDDDDYCSPEEEEEDITGREIEGKVAALLVCTAASLVALGTAADVLQQSKAGLQALDIGCHQKNPTDCVIKEEGHAKIIFAVVVGTLTMVASLVRLVLIRYQADNLLARDIYLSIVMAAMWACCAALVTSKGGPFSKTNNGYFSTWIALISSLYFCFLSSQPRTQHKMTDEFTRQNGQLVIVFVASMIEMAVAADFCDTDTDNCDPALSKHCQPPCTGQQALAIVVGVLSVLSVGVHLVLTRIQHPRRDAYEFILAPILTVTWAVGAAVNTSAKGPFPSSCDYANGYFATWVSFFFAMRYAWSVLLMYVSRRQSWTAERGDPLAEGLVGGQPYSPLASPVPKVSL